MAYRFVYPGNLSGFSGHSDFIEGKDRHSDFLGHNAPALRASIRDLPAVPLLLVEKEDFDLEQKKTTQRVVF